MLLGLILFWIVGNLLFCFPKLAIWAWVRPAIGGGVAPDEVETDAGT